jgi:ribosomal protein S18 acetylase RimI-like enzyme
VQASVRTAGRPGDARGIARVHVASWRATYDGLLPDAYLSRLTVPALATSWGRKLSRQGDLRGVWVAERRRRVIGFVEVGACIDDDSLAGFAGEVFMLYVHPEHVGRGVGRALLSRALEALAASPYYWVVIWVVEGNRRARRFYRHLGLRADGATRVDRFAGQPVSVVRHAGPLNPVWTIPR